MESIFAVADVFWVAHLGADAVATVGLTESMLTMIYTVAMGLSIGATALVARRTGEQDPEGAARAAGQSILLGVIVAGAIALAAAPWAPSAAGVDGRVAGGDRIGQRVHARDARRQRHGRPAVPDERGVPRVRRCGDRDARAVARQRAEHRARPLLHLRARAVPEARRRRRRGRDEHRPGDRGAVPDRDARPRSGPAPRHARTICGSTCRSCGRCSSSRDPARFRSSSARRATSGWCESCRCSAAPRSPATRSASA